MTALIYLYFMFLLLTNSHLSDHKSLSLMFRNLTQTRVMNIKIIDYNTIARQTIRKTHRFNNLQAMATYACHRGAYLRSVHPYKSS